MFSLILATLLQIIHFLYAIIYFLLVIIDLLLSYSTFLFNYYFFVHLIKFCAKIYRFKGDRESCPTINNVIILTDAIHYYMSLFYCDCVKNVFVQSVLFYVT